VKEAAAGKLTAGQHKLGLKGGYVDLVLNDKHPAVTDEIKAAVEGLRKKLVDAK
jgi:basic membrane lipoprotein Med (substrate-binding protein (PBP1-ABC) superfamily)